MTRDPYTQPQPGDRWESRLSSGAVVPFEVVEHVVCSIPGSVRVKDEWGERTFDLQRDRDTFIGPRAWEDPPAIEWRGHLWRTDGAVLFRDDAPRPEAFVWSPPARPPTAQDLDNNERLMRNEPYHALMGRFDARYAPVLRWADRREPRGRGVGLYRGDDLVAVVMCRRIEPPEVPTVDDRGEP